MNEQHLQPQEEYLIECEQCGAFYNEIEDACPECGFPSPLLAAEGYYDDQYPADEYVDDRTGYDDGVAYNEAAYDPYYQDSQYQDPHFVPDDYGYQHDTQPFQPMERPPSQPISPPPSQPFDPFPSPDTQPFRPASQPFQPIPRPDSQPFRPVDYYDDGNGYGYDSQPMVAEVPAQAETSWLTVFTRFSLGCVGMLVIYACAMGGVGAWAAYQGLQENTAEIDEEILVRYNKGLAYLDAEAYDLAIAEFNYVLSFDSEFRDAREQRAEAERRLQEREPTPTSPAFDNAAARLFEEANALISQRQWVPAAQKLSQLRGLDFSYEVERVSEMLYTASYQNGLDLLANQQVEEAQLAFQAALSERPNDGKAQAEQIKANRYLEADRALTVDKTLGLANFKELYTESPNYLDVSDRLLEAYELVGDEFALEGEWCRAEIQYVQALILEPTDKIETKAQNSGEKCNGDSAAEFQATDIEDEDDLATPTSVPTRALTATPTKQASASSNVDDDNASALATPSDSSTESTSEIDSTTDNTTTDTAVSSDSKAEENSEGDSEAGEAVVGGPTGSIFFAEYNESERQWHVLNIPATGGSERLVVAIEAMMPAVDVTGRYLLYRSTAVEAVGFKMYDMNTGETRRITIFAQDILPRFGADNGQFVFASQEPATNRWLIHLGALNPDVDSKIVEQGRTPAWAVDGGFAFQGTTPDGNNPGIYVAPFIGGQADRITTDESDRSPAFSPDGSQIAYMSTRGGNWDLYITDRSGGVPTQITSYAGQDGLPVWSPDGNYLAYVSDEGGAWNIYTISATGGTPTKITSWSSLRREDWLMSQLSWSPR